MPPDSYRLQNPSPHVCIARMAMILIAIVVCVSALMWISGSPMSFALCLLATPRLPPMLRQQPAPRDHHAPM